MRAKDLGNILILAAMLGGLLWFTRAGGDSCAGAAEFLAAGANLGVGLVALGAQVLEKHFTYHVQMPGDDHEGALTPETLGDLVRGVQRIERMLGTGDKKPVAAEQKAMAALRVEMREVGFDT